MVLFGKQTVHFEILLLGDELLGRPEYRPKLVGLESDCIYSVLLLEPNLPLSSVICNSKNTGSKNWRHSGQSAPTEFIETTPYYSPRNPVGPGFFRGEIFCSDRSRLTDNIQRCILSREFVHVHKLKSMTYAQTLASR